MRGCTEYYLYSGEGDRSWGAGTGSDLSSIYRDRSLCCQHGHWGMCQGRECCPGWGRGSCLGHCHSMSLCAPLWILWNFWSCLCPDGNCEAERVTRARPWICHPGTSCSTPLGWHHSQSTSWRPRWCQYRGNSWRYPQYLAPPSSHCCPNQLQKQLAVKLEHIVL